MPPRSLTNAQLAAKLDSRLCAIEEKLDTILRTNERRDVERETLKSIAEANRATLEGNGKEGMKSRVAVLTDQVKTSASWTKAIAIVFVVQALAVLAGLLTHSIEIVR